MLIRNLTDQEQDLIAVVSEDEREEVAYLESDQGISSEKSAIQRLCLCARYVHRLETLSPGERIGVHGSRIVWQLHINLSSILVVLTPPLAK